MVTSRAKRDVPRGSLPLRAVVAVPSDAKLLRRRVAALRDARTAAADSSGDTPDGSFEPRAVCRA